MKRIPLVAALICGFAIVAIHAAPVHADENHAKHAATAPVAVPAIRWGTDTPLREGMGRVRAALDELRHFEIGHMPSGMALERVTAIEEATKYMFTHCKLAADADAALHGMLAPLLKTAQRLKKDPQDISAVAAMRSAVADYPRYFDDPQWLIVDESMHGKH